MSQVFFSQSLQELHPSHVKVHCGYISCKYCNVFSVGTSIHAQGTGSEPWGLCIREHQSLRQMLSRVIPGSLTSLKNSQLVRTSWRRSCSCDSFGSQLAGRVLSF